MIVLLMWYGLDALSDLISNTYRLKGYLLTKIIPDMAQYDSTSVK